MIEEKPLIGEDPPVACQRLALEKAGAVSKQFPADVVIGADTVVVLDGKAMGKPRDAEHCREMIRRLSRRSHEVMTGIAVCRGDRCISDLERTLVHFRSLSDEEIDAYVATGEGLDKAGGYGIQGRGALLVSSIEGCYFNVVGLPLQRLSRILGQFGFSLKSQWEVIQ